MPIRECVCTYVLSCLHVVVYINMLGCSKQLYQLKPCQRRQQREMVDWTEEIHVPLAAIVYSFNWRMMQGKFPRLSYLVPALKEAIKSTCTCTCNSNLFAAGLQFHQFSCRF